MRSLFLAAALALLTAGFLPCAARAQVVYYSYPAYAPVPYTAVVPGVYTPTLAAPTYYEPPYLWSSRYYVGPYTRGWSYQRYYPGTNQYYYQYRVRPRWGW